LTTISDPPVTIVDPSREQATESAVRIIGTFAATTPWYSNAQLPAHDKTAKQIALKIQGLNRPKLNEPLFNGLDFDGTDFFGRNSIFPNSKFSSNA
jgi:hypothetical protein